jgi:hypothetical protein
MAPDIFPNNNCLSFRSEKSRGMKAPGLIEDGL